MSGLSAFLVAALLSAGTATTDVEVKAVEKKRVVVRVNVTEDDNAYSYAFVDHGNGEPVVLDSFLAERGYLGISLLELTPELRTHFGAPAARGVMISAVDEDGPASESGLEAGDVLLTIDGSPVAASAEVMQIISHGKAGQTVRMELIRDGSPMELEATLAMRERRQLDLGGLITVESGTEDHGEVEIHRLVAPTIELDPEVLEKALEQMRQHFESPEWKLRVERFDGSEAELKQRIQELHERLQELERELQELDQ